MVRQRSPYLVAPVAGFTPQLGRLVSMMNYARRTTLDEVEGLSVEHLDYLHDADSNTIGALLLHIAAVEASYQAATFGPGGGFEASEIDHYRAALNLGARARREIRGHGADYYLSVLENVRAKTLEEFARRDDSWLDEEEAFWGGLPANNYFKWFHVFEDEINHRGQLRWLRKRALENC
jgi:uncharacterized damage-inducible protein DinB